MNVHWKKADCGFLERQVQMGMVELEGLQRGVSNILQVMDMFFILIVMTVSQIYSYVEIYQMADFKNVAFIIF